MNSRLIISAAVMAATAGIASAEPAPGEVNAGVSAGAVTGALVAGPPGALVGAALGGAIGQRVALAGELPDTRQALEASEGRRIALERAVDELEVDLAGARATASRLEGLEQATAGLSSRFLFRTGSAELAPEAGRRLDDLAVLLRLMPDLEVHVEGHADARGGEAENLALSEARALVVSDALRARGVAPDQIQTWAYGEESAAATAEDPEGLAFDRRVDVVLLPADGRLARHTGGNL